MNVTFLIGNGFDLGIGLKTAYSDFYNIYCKSDSNDSLAVKKFKSEIQGNYENWSDFEVALGEYATKVESDEDYLEVFEDFVEKFSDYLKREEENFDPSKNALIVKTMKDALTSYYNIRPADKEALVKAIDGNRVVFNFVSFNYTMCLNDCLATVYKGNIIKNLIMDCQSYTKYRPNETTGGIFVSWRRKEELPTGA